MPAFLLLLSGMGVLLLMFYDLCRTTISVASAGPVTACLSHALWHPARRIHEKFDTPWLLKTIGPCLAFLLLVMWVALSWLGWWLIFSSHSGAVVESNTRLIASPVELAYFIGFTITTLGYGDFVPSDSTWKLVAILAAINGFSVFTLAVTYWLSIVTAVVKKRRLASSIALLGPSPNIILKRNRGEGDFDILGSQVDKIVAELLELEQQQRAYPILHYYHADSVREALPVSLVRLYLSLKMVVHASPTLSPSSSCLIPMGIDAMEDFFHSLDIRGDKSPDVNLQAYMESGYNISDLDTPLYKTAPCLDDLPMKPMLSAYLAKEGWRWEQVWGQPLKNSSNVR
ncbi:potassium channel family protein [Halomonas sp. HK25]|uniref:potassium channel family protein n=1 Tax=Halomonas sp. HK25 TaxID=3394321 RepID=UPI0039FD6B85